MTFIYDWYGWPNSVSVYCPKCKSKVELSGPMQVIELVGPSTRPLTREYTDFVEGKISCLQCGYVNKTRIEWPVDAFYRGEVKGKLLWAWNKEHLIAIRDFIESADRNYRGVKYSSALYHLPEHFKISKNKDACLKTLNKMITKI